MDAAKIRLSPKEMELVTNADWILTKNGIMLKVKMLLQEIQSAMLDHTVHFPALHSCINKIPPKISKGENYKGLPYLVLDYPRIFGKNDTLAIRTMFWWGNFFSITLQLSGKYKRSSIQLLTAAFDLLKKNSFSYCINHHEWDHHFENDNYRSLQNFSLQEYETLIKEKPFIKIAKKIPLCTWEDAGSLLLNDFKMLAGIISCPNDEKDL